MIPNEAARRAQILTLLTQVQGRVMQCELDLLHADYDDTNVYRRLSDQLDTLQSQIKQIQNTIKEDPSWNSLS